MQAKTTLEAQIRIAQAEAAAQAEEEVFSMSFFLRLTLRMG
jgi:hypothetical protein